MTTCRFRAAAMVLWLIASAVPALADAAATTLFRVFLHDGSSLVSYGEVARVGDRVVFSMPTSASQEAPDLQLVNIGASQVDWDKTSRYAESARATEYLRTQAALDYAKLSNDVAAVLNDVAHTNDPAKRLAIVEQARKALAEWPISHYSYNLTDVRQMLAILDEAIADLRARAAPDRFNLTLVASVPAPVVLEPTLPPPTPQEAIAQTLMAARLTDSPAERLSLLSAGLAGLNRDAHVLPSAWLVETRDATSAQIAGELETNRAYTSMVTRILGLASQRARAADVLGLQRLLERIRTEDQALGGKRQDTVAALVDSVEAQLDAVRRLHLEQERWKLRAAAFRSYRLAIRDPLQRLSTLQPALENIKALAGSAPEALGRILAQTAVAARALAAVVPPTEFEAAHALLMSATQLADSAARTRREAALTGNIARAWDASAAAAGALMLSTRARTDIQALLRLPQLPQLPQ